MVELGIHVAAAQIVQTVNVVGRADPGKRDVVTNQVRLIEIPMLQCNFSPVLYGGPMRPPQNALKPANASEQLRIQANFEAENINESFLAQAGILSEFARHLRPCVPEPGKGESHRAVLLQTSKASLKEFLHQPETTRERNSPAQSFTKLSRRCSPNRLQIKVAIAKVAHVTV